MRFFYLVKQTLFYSPAWSMINCFCVRYLPFRMQFKRALQNSKSARWQTAVNKGVSCGRIKGSSCVESFVLLSQFAWRNCERADTVCHCAFPKRLFTETALSTLNEYKLPRTCPRHRLLFAKCIFKLVKLFVFQYSKKFCSFKLWNSSWTFQVLAEKIFQNVSFEWAQSTENGTRFPKKFASRCTIDSHSGRSSAASFPKRIFLFEF